MLENLGAETLAIKFDLKMRLFKSSAGLRKLWLIDVVRKHSISNLGSFPVCLALIRALLIVWICLSIKPFDFGNFGDNVINVIKLPLLGKFFECFTGVLWSIVTNNSAGNTMFREYLLYC